MYNDNETNKGLLYSTYKQYAPELLEFDKLNYGYFKYNLTNSDVLKIVAYIAFEQSAFFKNTRSKRNRLNFFGIKKRLNT